jgi:hypothetical protein
MAFCRRKKAAICGNQIEQVLIGAKIEMSIAEMPKSEIFRAPTESMAVWLALTGPARLA